MDHEEQKVIMRNVERILKARSIKRSDFEKQVGLSAGYLSRLVSSDSDKEPANRLSMDVAERFAKELGVSVDYLQFDQTVRKDEQVLIDFLESVIYRTKQDEIYWEKYEADEVKAWSESENWQWRENLWPLVLWTDRVDEGIYRQAVPYNRRTEQYLFMGRSMWPRGRKIKGVVYSEVKPTDAVYFVELEDINVFLYLFRVQYWDVEGKQPLDDVIEAYLQPGVLPKGAGMYDPDFLCNSVEWNDYIKAKLNDIYNMAADRCENARISQEAWEALEGCYKKMWSEHNEEVKTEVTENPEVK